MDQNVGAVEPLTDLVGQSMRGSVGGLERRPVGELEMDVDVTARAGAAASELVEADDAARSADLADRLADRVQVRLRQSLNPRS